MRRIITRVMATAAVFAAAITAPSVSRGDWSFVPPATVGARDDVFAAVHGTAADDIWAVGAWGPPDWNYRCLIEHFDGVAWTRLPVPEAGPSEALRGVLAIARDHALAVGRYTPYGYTRQPLAMEWNGAEWARLAVPDSPGGRSFNALDRAPGGEIWVAGDQGPYGETAGLAFITRRAGADWSFEFAPRVPTGLAHFNAIHAAADDRVWVVGHTYAGAGTFRILIMRYDGSSSWTWFDVPTPGLENDFLFGVRALAPDDVWAVGDYYHPQRLITQPLIMHFDGTAWTQVGLPDPPEGPATLRSIVALAPDDIFAAGTHGLGPSPAMPRPYLLHYDGATWSEVVLPATGGQAEWFLGMAVIPNGDVWAVGQYSDGTTMEPMAFRNATEIAAAGGPSGGPALRLRSVPNPFGSGVSTSFILDAPGPVRLRVLDLSGRVVRVLLESGLGAGPHVVRWDGLDGDGRPVPAGIYFHELTAGTRTAREKVIRLR